MKKKWSNQIFHRFWKFWTSIFGICLKLILTITSFVVSTKCRVNVFFQPWHSLYLKKILSFVIKIMVTTSIPLFVERDFLIFSNEVVQPSLNLCFVNIEKWSFHHQNLKKKCSFRYEYPFKPSSNVWSVRKQTFKF